MLQKSNLREQNFGAGRLVCCAAKQDQHRFSLMIEAPLGSGSQRVSTGVAAWETPQARISSPTE